MNTGTGNAAMGLWLVLALASGACGGRGDGDGMTVELSQEEQALLVPPGRSAEFLDMEVPPNHLTHSQGIGGCFEGRDAGHVSSRCLNCHTTSQTSFATEEWDDSLHALAGISCEACHGSHEVAFVAHPGPDRCRACHPQQEQEMRSGLHADNVKNGLRCDSCHRAHAFDLAATDDPGVCLNCHKDSIHVQRYPVSKMGAVVAREGFDEDGVPAAATCKTCHVRPSPVHEVTSDMRCDTVMNHDVSAGLGRLPGGALDEEARQEMVTICLQCHARSISEYRLRNSDPIITRWHAGGRWR